MRNSHTQPVLRDNFWLGFLLGIGLPALFFLLYFLLRFKDITLDHYVNFLMQSNNLVHVVSLAVCSNLFPFLFFVRTTRFKAGRGVIGITILFVILLFVLKVTI